MAWSFFTPRGDMGYGTALPAAPFDGQMFTLVDSTSAPTYAWLLRYNAAKASNKWDFIGGSSAVAQVAAAETTTSLTYVALTTAGPSIALPVAGDYIVRIGAGMGNNTNGNGAMMSYDIGGTGASDNDACMTNLSNDGGQHPNNARTQKKTGLTAVTLTAKYRAVTGTTATFQNRWMEVTPIALGG